MVQKFLEANDQVKEVRDDVPEEVMQENEWRHKEASMRMTHGQKLCGGWGCWVLGTDKKPGAYTG